MLIFFVKSQLALFDAPVHVGAHVRKDGTVVKPHIRIQKVTIKQPSLFDHHHAEPAPAAKPKRTKLDTFLHRYGGAAGMAKILAGLPEGQQQQLIAKMAEVGKTTPEAVAEMLAQGAGAQKQEPADTLDLFSRPAEPEKKPEPVEAKKPEPAPEPEPELQLTEHTTGKGKTLRGVVRTDLTQAQAKEIDPYTFRKNGGWFIREKHLKNKPVEAKAPAPAPTPAPAPEPAPAPAPAVAHDPAAPFGVAAGTSKGKRREINASVAARLAEGGPYSADDLAMFRQYSGNGGCGDSLNEFYTDPGVARAMWTALRSLGFEHGTALEPSCATGVFMHTAPAGVRVTGVELDPVSAQAASALHGDRHEIHTASFERFATTDDRQFDVVIGNPPYGPRGFLAKDDKVSISTAEQYFTDTALDKTKAGGLVALVVPTGIMDSKTARGFREDMLRKGEFLGAMRMPNTAFEHSHTEVTTDVIFLRKRPDDVAGALGTVDQATLQKLGVWDDEFLAGSYFTGRGAENILGTMTEGWRAKAGMGNDITVEGSMDGVAEAIAKFQPDSEARGATDLTVQHVLDALGDDETAKDRAVSAAARRPYANTAKVGDTKTVDGVQYVLQGDPPRWHRVDEFMQTAAISDAQALAADIDRLFTGDAVDRPELEKRIRAYVEKHGVPADDVDLMTAASVDKTLYRLIGAVNRKGELSDAVLGKAPRKIEGSFDTAAQVLALEHDGGTFTAGELSDRLNKQLDEVVDQLAADPRYAYAGGGKWTTMEAYLTGELWPKLDAARAALESGAEPDMADKRRLQVERLEKTIDAKSLEDVDFQMNSAFIPTDVLAAFLNWKQYDAPDANDWTKKQDPVAVTFADGVYAITGGNQYGDIKLLDKYLNRTGIRKDDDLPRVERLNAEFKDWLCGSTYRDRVEDIYNRTFRGYVAPEFSDAPIDVPGLTTPTATCAPGAGRACASPWRWARASLPTTLALAKPWAACCWRAWLWSTDRPRNLSSWCQSRC